MWSWQMRSSSSVLTPGRTWGATTCSTSAASRPATRIFSTCSGVLREMVMAPLSPSPAQSAGLATWLADLAEPPRWPPAPIPACDLPWLTCQRLPAPPLRAMILRLCLALPPGRRPRRAWRHLDAGEYTPAADTRAGVSLDRKDGDLATEAAGRPNPGTTRPAPAQAAPPFTEPGG